MLVFPAPVSASRRRTSGSLLDALFSERARDCAGSAIRSPAMDVLDSDTAFTLAFDVPGATRDRLKVSVQGRRVVLETSDTAEDPLAEGQRILYRERAEARYGRTVVLPAEVDPASASAKFDNGVLTLSLAKKLGAGVTHIAIA